MHGCSIMVRLALVPFISGKGVGWYGGLDPTPNFSQKERPMSWENGTPMYWSKPRLFGR